MATTDKQALNAMKTLLDYYRNENKKFVLSEFCDTMILRLGKEIDRLSKKDSHP